jgi:hypothetical protein
VGSLKVGGGVGRFESVSNVTCAVGEDEDDIVGESDGESVGNGSGPSVTNGILELDEPEELLLGEGDAVYSSSQP